MKENEELYFPMDSNFGNLCLPHYDSITNSYYCYSKFENNYNELSTNFSVSSSNQNEYFEINTTAIYKNGNIKDLSSQFIFLKNDDADEIDYYIFKFIFRNDEISFMLKLKSGSTLIKSLDNYQLRADKKIYEALFDGTIEAIPAFNEKLLNQIVEKNLI